MAYILGFIAADGALIKNKRGANFLEIEITDKELLKSIRKILGSNHKISTRHRSSKLSYRLQIGSKAIYNDLFKLGIKPKKSLTIKLPKTPNNYFNHFLRGYFDGDGNVIFGKYQNSVRFMTRFTSGSRSILLEISKKLHKMIQTNGLLTYYSNAWRLNYGRKDSKNIYGFMYKNSEGLLYLKRKHRIYLKAVVA